MKEVTIRRILVALDASSSCVEGLKTAGDLAARLGAELAGLFVEDIDLLRAVEFPFALECGYLGEGARKVDPRELEGQLRAQAERMRRILEAVAAERRIAWNFRIIRGSVSRELLSAGTEADLIIMGRSGRSLLGPRRLGSTVRDMIARGSGMTLILHPGAARTDHPMVVYDGTDSARKALSVASAFAVDESTPLRIFLLADSREEAQKFRKEVNEALQDTARQATFQFLIRSGYSEIAHFVKLAGGGPLLLPGERWNTREEELIALVKEIEGPVLVVR